jgi:plastocyanin
MLILQQRNKVAIAASVLIVAATALTFLLARHPEAVSDNPPTAPKIASRVVVHYGEDGFEQPVVKVRVGTAVTWINDDNKPHTLVADTATGTKIGLETDSIPPGQKYTLVFNQKGTYGYHQQDDSVPEDFNEAAGTVIVE